MRLEDHIQDIPDFPKPGIVFKDITPLFLDAEALRHAVDELAGSAREWEVDYVVVQAADEAFRDRLVAAGWRETYRDLDGAIFETAASQAGASAR